MAPERMNGGRGDLRSDIYSLGATLYSIAAGGYLFEGLGTGPDSYMNWRWHHAKETPRPLTDRVPGFPTALWSILERCLLKDPDRRYGSYEELLQDLTAIRRQLPVPGESADFLEETTLDRVRGRRGSILRKAVAAFGIMAVLVFVFFLADPFKGRPEPRPNPPVASKPEAPIIEASPPPKSAEIPAAPKESPPREPEAVPTPPPPPAPVPLEKRLASYSPTADEISLVGALMDLFAAHRQELLSRSYDPMLTEIAALERDRLGLRPDGPIPSEKEYSARHVRAARDLVLQARGAVQARLNAILSEKGRIALKLADGGSASGSIAGEAPGSIRLQDGGGKEFAVPLSKIASEEFLSADAPSPVRVSVQGLSLEPGRTLGEVLGLGESAGELVFSLPVLVRLGRLEAEDRIKSAIRPGAQQPDGKQALAALASLAANAPRVLGFYRALDAEFKAAAREEEALRAFLASQYSRVLASFEGTLCHLPAAQLLLERFERDLGVGAEELMAGTGFVDFGWKLRPTEADEKKKRGYLRRDPFEDAIILADPVGPRHFLMEEGVPQAPEGVLVRFRFEPQGTSPDSSEWRFPLVTGGGGGVYLKLQARKIALYRPVFSLEGQDEELAASKLPAGQNDRTLVLVPGESGFLHVYLDGALAFSRPLKEAAIPRALGFTVLGAQLTIKKVTVKKSPASTQENPK